MPSKMSRDTALKIHYILDQLVPPIIRDCKWIMSFPLWVMFRHRYKSYLNFKEIAFDLSEEEFRGFYRMVSDTAIERDTDLNKASIDKIMMHTKGDKILDVGCGRGFLVDILSKNHNDVSGVDIVIPPVVREKFPKVKFFEDNVESLPFDDSEFDTVICTHTLEHVRNIHLAISELRRVSKRLIIVVPRQRPYKFTFDLHLNFFPYNYSLLSVMGKIKGESLCEDADGDIFYMEQKSS
ncbi:MAG: class I SAM-dependent methyltransferase [Rickettsiales bacterium]